MLLALWLYGLSEGVNSARAIARLSEAHAAYRWICGGVRVNYHTLSDFRTGHGAALDELFSQVLGLLLNQRLITLSGWRRTAPGCGQRGGGIVPAPAPAPSLRGYGAEASGAARSGDCAGRERGQCPATGGRVARRARV